jgi:hypothetical protein
MREEEKQHMHNSEARCAQKFRFTLPGLQVRVGQLLRARQMKGNGRGAARDGLTGWHSPARVRGAGKLLEAHLVQQPLDPRDDGGDALGELRGLGPLGGHAVPQRAAKGSSWGSGGMRVARAAMKTGWWREREAESSHCE